MQMPNTTPNYRNLAKRLCGDLQEARDTVAGWAAYASDYFQQKHDLAGDIAHIDRQIASALAALAPEPQGPTDEALRNLWRLGWESKNSEDGAVLFAREVLDRYGRQP